MTGIPVPGLDQTTRRSLIEHRWRKAPSRMVHAAAMLNPGGLAGGVHVVTLCRPHVMVHLSREGSKHDQLPDDTKVTCKKCLERMPKPTWLIFSHEHEAWWKPDSMGYTWDIAQAGLYQEREATAQQERSRGNETAIPMKLALEIVHLERYRVAQMALEAQNECQDFVMENRQK